VDVGPITQISKVYEVAYMNKDSARSITVPPNIKMDDLITIIRKNLGEIES